MLLKYCKLAEELKLDLVDVELEIRFRVPKLDLINPTSHVITYYRNNSYPDMIFRSYDGYNIESKEIVERTTYRKTNLVLSIEQKNVDITVVPTTTVRKIKRSVLETNPLVEAICENDEYTIEIEFDINTYKQVPQLIAKYKNRWWPPEKPIELTLLGLSKKLSRKLEEWAFSFKADGEHCMVFDNVIIFDKGSQKVSPNPQFVYEGEFVDGKLLLFDCLVYQGANISKLSYKKRWKHIEQNQRKEIWFFSNLEELRMFCYWVPPFKSDGFIFTSNRKTYKSKWISTVDVRYENKQLLFQLGLVWRHTDLELENSAIYEFNGDGEMIRQRLDKTTANYKWTNESNQLYKFAYGIGVPSVRVAHNKIKYTMLNNLPKTTLLDIGSGKGGDVDKWIHLKFKKVFALDPQLKLRKHHYVIDELRESTKTLDIPLKYESISIFFVPWDDSFIPYILKANYLAISYMVAPTIDINEVYSIEKKNQKVYINIPESSTATEICELDVDYQKIFKEYLSDWELMEYKTLIYDDCIEYNLTQYYRHFIYKRKNGYT